MVPWLRVLSSILPPNRRKGGRTAVEDGLPERQVSSSVTSPVMVSQETPDRLGDDCSSLVNQPP